VYIEGQPQLSRSERSCAGDLQGPIEETWVKPVLIEGSPADQGYSDPAQAFGDAEVNPVDTLKIGAVTNPALSKLLIKLNSRKLFRTAVLNRLDIDRG